MRSTQFLFIFAFRGEVQRRLLILRCLTLWYLSNNMLVLFFLLCFSFLPFFFDTRSEPLNRSQTRRPDPFRLSAVTTRGLCLYSGRDCTCSCFFIKFDMQSQRNKKKNVKYGWSFLAEERNRFRTKKWRLKVLELRRGNKNELSKLSLSKIFLKEFAHHFIC